MGKETWKHIDIPFHLGFGLQQYTGLGYAQMKNLIYDEKGSLRTRPSCVPIANPGTATTIVDLWIRPAQSAAFCISNSNLYYTASLGNAWTDCTSAGTQQLSGTWAELGGAIIFCPAQGTPIWANVSTPTVWATLPLTGGSWTGNGSCCLVYKNCLLVADGSKVYYSLPDSIALHATERYFYVEYNNDAITKMLNLNGTLIVLKGRAMYARRINNANFSSNQFENIIDGVSLIYAAMPSGACNDITGLNIVTPSGVLRYAGGIENYTKGWTDKKYIYANWNSRLYFWNVMNFIILYSHDLATPIVYDIRRQIWTSWSHVSNISCIYNQEGTYASRIYTGHSDGTMHRWDPTYEVGASGAAYEATLDQEFLTPYLIFGDSPIERDAKKYVKRIYIQGKGWSTVELYARNKESEDFTKIFPVTGYGTYTENDVVIPIPADTGQYRQHYIKLAGTGQCVLRSLAVDVEFGRLYNAPD